MDHYCSGKLFACYLEVHNCPTLLILVTIPARSPIVWCSLWLLPLEFEKLIIPTSWYNQLAFGSPLTYWSGRGQNRCGTYNHKHLTGMIR